MLDISEIMWKKRKKGHLNLIFKEMLEMHSLLDIYIHTDTMKKEF